jgi:hypothetical protein
MTWTSVRRQGRFGARTGITVAAVGVLGDAMLHPLTLLPSAFVSVRGYAAPAWTKALARVSIGSRGSEREYEHGS